MKWLVLLVVLSFNAKASWKDGDLGTKCTNNIDALGNIFPDDIAGRWAPDLTQLVPEMFEGQAPTNDILAPFFLFPGSTLWIAAELNFRTGGFEGGRITMSLISSPPDDKRPDSIHAPMFSMDMDSSTPDQMEFCYKGEEEETRQYFVRVRQDVKSNDWYYIQVKFTQYQGHNIMELAVVARNRSGRRINQDIEQNFIRFFRAETCVPALTDKSS